MDRADQRKAMSLFEGYGVELEYMIVSRATLDVAPICDRLMEAAAGAPEAEIERGDIAWSNELALHVVELKTNGPAPVLDGLEQRFHGEVEVVDGLLEPLGARLMPTAMHPWMDPAREARLWPHEYGPVYRVFDLLFDCRGHGWSNLQSTHLNLPYRGDDELRRLHSAIRLVLPLLPALAASSPVVDGRQTGLCDSRLDHYRVNCRRLPSVTGRVIPEVVIGVEDYRRRILDPIARDIAPFDTEGVMDAEWVNARGAIARLVRDSIEIRLLDVQEQPAADLAILRLVVAAVRALVEERDAAIEAQERLASDELEQVLLATIRDGDRAPIDNPALCECLGVGTEPKRVGQVWQRLAARHGHDPSLDVILEHGPLARRIVRALEEDTLRDVYRELCDCLHQGRMFRP